MEDAVIVKLIHDLTLQVQQQQASTEKMFQLIMFRLGIDENGKPNNGLYEKVNNIYPRLDLLSSRLDNIEESLRGNITIKSLGKFSSFLAKNWPAMIAIATFLVMASEKIKGWLK